MTTNRNPSRTMHPVRPSGILPPVGPRRRLFNELFDAAKAAFPDIHGLTCVDAGRAYFQADGDSTYYSVAITLDEAELMGYMPPVATAELMYSRVRS